MSIPPAIQRTQHLGNVQAARLVVGELFVGVSNGSSVSGGPTGSGDWRSYVPTITNGTKASTANVDSATYQIDGKRMFLNYTYRQPDNTGGAAGSGSYLISLPPGVTAKMKLSGEIVGSATVSSNGSVHVGVVQLFSTTQVLLQVGRNDAGPSVWASGFLPFNTAGVTFASFSAVIELA